MKISVYIPSYNQKDYLVESVNSVLAQTFRPHQIIIVDDCSSDGSQELIAGFASLYPNLITPIFHEKNTGVARVRVDALTAVTGDYVTYVDGDDRFLLTKLEKEAKLLLERPDVQIAFSNYVYVTADGNKHIKAWVGEGSEPPPEGNVFAEVFARQFPRNTLFHMELLPYRCLQLVGFHDTSLTTHEDWDIRIRLSKYFKVTYCPEILSEIRVHKTGLSSQARRVLFNSWNQVIDKNLPLLNDFNLEERERIKMELMPKYARLAYSASQEEFMKMKLYTSLVYLQKAIKIHPSVTLKEFAQPKKRMLLKTIQKLKRAIR